MNSIGSGHAVGKPNEKVLAEVALMCLKFACEEVEEAKEAVKNLKKEPESTGVPSYKEVVTRRTRTASSKPQPKDEEYDTDDYVVEPTFTTEVPVMSDIYEDVEEVEPDTAPDAGTLPARTGSAHRKSGTS